MIGSVYKQGLVVKESGKLGIIGVRVAGKDKKEHLAKAPCDFVFKKNKNYDLYIWNTRYAQCPKCIKEKTKSCNLCNGEPKILTFSYIIKNEGEDPGTPWLDDNMEEMKDILNKDIDDSKPKPRRSKANKKVRSKGGKKQAKKITTLHH